jgi:membrane protein DedA with SNARE-associated domain
MIESILIWLAEITTSIISAGGYAGVALLMAIESACIPLPSEIIMPFAGYLVSTGQFNLFMVATAGAIGCNLGSIIAYEAGKRGGRPLIARYGRFLLIGVDEVDKAEAFFAKHGSKAVLIGRLLPVIRTFIGFPAGVAKMPLGKFHLYTFVGSWPWCFGLAWVGMKLGAAWNSNPTLKAIFHSFDAVILIGIIAAGGWFVWHRLKANRV